MKSTVRAYGASLLVSSLAFSDYPQLEITHYAEAPGPYGVYWQHVITTSSDGNDAIDLSYSGPCSSEQESTSIAEGFILNIRTFSSSASVPYSMSLV